jgi:pyruvate,water dikinase
VCAPFFPLQGHKFICDHWFLTSWWNKIREFGDLLVAHGFATVTASPLSRLRCGATGELLLTWATGGEGGPKYWPPIVAQRRELLARLADWTPPPAVGAVPEAVLDPALIMLWGVTTQRVHAWAREAEGGSELSGTPASPGVVEGVARVVRSARDIGDVRDGEILVCSITSPAWAPIFPKIRAAVTDIGGVMSHAAIVCREYALPAVVGTGRATSQIVTGQQIRVDGTAGTVTILE